ncbi:dentin sialophosphoprotein-related [Striga hermonthica]|uniref:Dentin sialophosphoprotein-related n=1 Tax=Striga hermonthica TaxID=68872 RepID=A0A9N7NA82_STRHE|nr:dentin sialophosphoprotein-related [Striga hermonthica]
MLQRQVISKQLEELQRRQHLQELGSNNNRNQNYAHQLSLVKQASGVQYPPAANGTPVLDPSRMFMAGNMQMKQHIGPGGLVLSQTHNFAPQFDVSSYRIHAPSGGENLNGYSYVQGLDNQNQSTFDGSFAGQRYNFSSQQIQTRDGLLVSNTEDYLLGQVQAGGSDSVVLSDNYHQQGFTVQKNASSLESAKRDENAASLDPLEQKILYNTDDFSWESTFGRNNKMSAGGFDKTVEMPSMQSGSWSALMQSAVAETSSSDAGVQEEWSGLSFQNPEPLNEGEKLQSDWVDRNLQNASSPCSKPHDMIQNVDSFSNFQSAQHLKQEEGYQPTGGSKLIQGSLALPNTWLGERMEHSDNGSHQNSKFSCTNDIHSGNTLSCHEFRAAFWSQGVTSDHMSGIQTNYNQVNEMNDHGYSVKAENMDPDAVSSAENVTASSKSVFELHNMDDASNDQAHAMQLSSKVSIPRNLPYTSPTSLKFGFTSGPTDHQLPQLYSSSSSFPLGISSARPPSNHITSDYRSQHSAPLVRSQRATEVPEYNAAVFHENSEMKISNSGGSEVPILQNQNVGFPPSRWTENQSTTPHECQQLEKENSVLEGSAEITNTKSLNRRGYEQDFVGKHYFELNFPESASLITNPYELGSDQAEVKSEAPSFPAREIDLCLHSLNQNHSPSNQMLSTSNNETDGVKNFLPKYSSIHNDHPITDARNLLLNALHLKNGAKSDSYTASQLRVLSGKASSMPHNQNYSQEVDICCQNRPISMNNSSNLAYQSHMNLQTASSWIKHYKTLNNGKILSMRDEAAQNNAAQQMIPGNLLDNSLIRQVDLANTGQWSGLCRSTVDTSVASSKLSPTCVLPTFQNLARSMPKKRKFAEFDMIPWHQGVNHGQSSLHDISTAESIWAQALKRKAEEASDAAVNVEELLPVIRAKKRLISTTQLIQQIFRPTPVIILCSDASLSSDSVAYVAARLELGDALSLTSQLASDTNNMSRLRTLKKTKACKFSEIVKAFIGRVKNVEATLSRVDKSLSLVDFKVEARELERFSTNNRFARFHTVRAPPINANNASSSHMATLFNPALKKYVIARALPEILPDGQNCLSL